MKIFRYQYDTIKYTKVNQTKKIIIGFCTLTKSWHLENKVTTLIIKTKEIKGTIQYTVFSLTPLRPGLLRSGITSLTNIKSITQTTLEPQSR